MNNTRLRRMIWLFIAVLVTILVIPMTTWAWPPEGTTLQKERFKWIVTKRLTVQNQAILHGDLDLNAQLDINGTEDSVQLNVQGHNTQSSDIVNVERHDSTDLFEITDWGQTSIHGYRDATTGYDYFLTVDGSLTGTLSGAKTYGIYVNLNRPSTAPPDHGNIDDAGIKVRVDNDAITATSGTVINAIDVQTKNDNDARLEGTIRGAQITADTDDSSGVTNACAIRGFVEGEGVVTTTMQVADFELARKQSTDPTYEWGVNIRNTSTSGGGADVGLRIESSYGAGGSAADDNWDYCIDMEPADAAVADIRLSQAETIHNLTDTLVTIEGRGLFDSAADGDQLVVRGQDGMGAYLIVGEQSDFTDVFNVDYSGNITVAGTSDLQGNLGDSAGTLTIADDVLVDGQADTEQLRVQGAASQGDWYFTVEESTGSDIFNVGPSGNITVAGTSNLMGNLFDSNSALTIADVTMVDGQADGEQLVVQGYAGQGAYLFVAETSAGTDRFTIDDSGNITVAGTSDLVGNLFDDAGALTIADNAMVDGQAAAIQLTVQGHTDQDANDLFVVENSAASDLFNIAADGSVTVTADLQDSAGTFTIIDDVLVDGQAEAEQLVVQANAAQNGLDTFIVENSAGTDVFEVEHTGNITVAGTSNLLGDIFDNSGVLTIIDNTLIDGQSDSAQLVVQGLTGQGSDIFRVEQGGGADIFNIDQDGTITITEMINDSDSAVTIEDNVLIDGQTGNEQLVVQANANQNGLDVFIVESSAGTDGFAVDASGNITVAGTSDLRGNLGDSMGTLTLADNVIVDGQAAAVQLTVQAHSDQDANDIFVVENSATSDLFAIGHDGAVTVTGNIYDSNSVVTVWDNLMVDGQDEQIQLLVQADADQGSDLIVAETSAGADVFNVSADGSITYSVSYADSPLDATNIFEAHSAQETDILRVQDDGGAETYMVITATGEMSWRSPVISCADLSYQLTVSDSAALVSNQGIADAGHGNGATQVIDLPDAKEGRHFCFVNWTTSDSGPTMAVNPQDSDQIAFLTNTNGDCISNTTSGDAICLTAQDNVFWLPTSETGTWADGN